MTDHQAHTRQASGQSIRVGKRRDKVGPEQEEYLDPSGQEGFGHARHLARYVITWRTPMVSRNIRQCLAMGGRAVTWPKSTSRDAQIAREGRQTRNGPSCLPTIGPLVHRTATQHDHCRLGRSIAPGQRHNALRRNARDPCGPLWRIGLHMGLESVKTHRVLRHKGAVAKPLRDDHVHQCQRQCRISAGTQLQHFV